MTRRCFFIFVQNRIVTAKTRSTQRSCFFICPGKFPGQIKSPQPLRNIYGRRPEASGESVVNPEPHVVRGLSPILQKNHPLSAASAPRIPLLAGPGRDEWAVKDGFDDINYFLAPVIREGKIFFLSPPLLPRQ